MFHQTITQRIYEIWKSIEKELESRAANFKFYALEIDENTNFIDNAQLTIFIRGIDDKYNATEEITSIKNDTIFTMEIYVCWNITPQYNKKLCLSLLKCQK